jgi:hypothetical protein
MQLVAQLRAALQGLRQAQLAALLTTAAAPGVVNAELAKLGPALAGRGASRPSSKWECRGCFNTSRPLPAHRVGKGNLDSVQQLPMLAK